MWMLSDVGSEKLSPTTHPPSWMLPQERAHAEATLVRGQPRNILPNDWRKGAEGGALSGPQDLGRTIIPEREQDGEGEEGRSRGGGRPEITKIAKELRGPWLNGVSPCPTKRKPPSGAPRKLMCVLGAPRS